jgi:hypothetical protein
VAAAHPDVAGLAVVNPLVDPPAPSFRDLLDQLLAAGERFLPGIGGDLADPDAREQAYDRLPVAALLSMSRGLETLLPRLVDVRCPVLIITSRHDNVVPTVSSDLRTGEARVARVQPARGDPRPRPRGAGASRGRLRRARRGVLTSPAVRRSGEQVS